VKGDASVFALFGSWGANEVYLLMHLLQYRKHHLYQAIKPANFKN